MVKEDDIVQQEEQDDEKLMAYLEKKMGKSKKKIEGTSSTRVQDPIVDLEMLKAINKDIAITNSSPSLVAFPANERHKLASVPKVVAVEKQPRIKKDKKGVAQKEVVVPFDDLANHVDNLQTIKDMGFGGFLHLDFPHNYPEFLAQLVLNFDVVGMKLNLDRNRSIDVKDVDVHMVYRIPIGGKEIVDAKDGNEDYKEVLNSYKRYHGGVLPNNVNKLVSKLAPAKTPLDDD
uniref:Uncharacterized protein n=1 Tax=Chenopodium quinoa TaxID=63459 RepID=A0A803MNA1_CHEQI